MTDSTTITDADAKVDGGSDGGSDAQSWLSSVPENLRDNEVLKQFATAGDAYRALVDLKVSSDNSITIPGEGASDEDRAVFLNKLGRPEKPEGYGLDKPELPEGMPYSDEAVQAYRGLAHQVGLNDSQAKSLFELHNKMAIESFKADNEARQKAQNEAVEGLKKDWGDGYDANIELAKRALKKFGGDNLTKFLDESGAGDNASVLKAFHAIGEAISDDAGSGPDGGNAGGDSLSNFFPSMKPKT